ncbi:MAG: D-sedoheptulose-7-phosphate isomerase [Ilumatobacteraceae bacterium]
MVATHRAHRVEFDESFADVALSLANVFRAGGKLLVAASGRDDHAQHVAVEFVHPVIVGKPALPAIACDATSLSTLLDPQDAVLLIATSTVELEAMRSYLPSDAHVFEVVANESTLVQRYHILWETVHLCLEHASSTHTRQTDTASMTLYPFLTAQSPSDDGLPASADVATAIASSTATKQSQMTDLAAHTMSAHREHVTQVAELIVATSDPGTIYTIGNGGSSCDAARLARLLSCAGIRSVCLSTNYATLSALANDVGVERIFARMIDGIATRFDVLVAFSTSGASKNLINALEVAKKKGLQTVGFAGYGGGQFVNSGLVDHMFVVDSDSVHRIQEAQGALIDAICNAAKKGKTR